MPGEAMMPGADIVLAHRSERSVLDGPDAARLRAFFINARPRFATCSGVAWFPGPYLAAVNLYGEHLRIYRVHADGNVADGPRLELLHEINESIGRSEDVAVAPDGRRLALTRVSSGKASVALHEIDVDTLAPGPAIVTLERPGPLHGLKFSPDSRHLAFTSIGTPGYVEVVRVMKDDVERSCYLENRFLPLRPKSVAFSPDGRFAAVVTAQNAAMEPAAGLGGRLSVHSFDAEHGVIDEEPLAELRGDGPLENNEMCAFLHRRPNRPYRILTANQGMDALAAFDFDAYAGSLAFAGIFSAEVTFPHGVDVSADGRFVAAANYGDDSIRVIRVPLEVGAEMPH